MNWPRFAVKHLVHRSIECSGWPRRKRSGLRGHLVILTYHSFGDGWPRGLLSTLPIHRFERQLEFLAKHFEIVPLETGLRYVRERRDACSPWLAITLDDGFLNNFTHALPILKRHGASATIFVATDFIDAGRPPWPTQLLDIVGRTRHRSALFPFRADLRTRECRVRFAAELKRRWKEYPPQKRFDLLEELRRHLGVQRNADVAPMSWGQLRAARRDGITIGSHTVYHSVLPAMNRVVAAEEAVQSRRRVESEIDGPCTLFAYPDGAYSPETASLVADAGYAWAVTQEPGANGPQMSSTGLLRIEVPYHDPLATFRVRVSTALRAQTR